MKKTFLNFLFTILAAVSLTSCVAMFDFEDTTDYHYFDGPRTISAESNQHLYYISEDYDLNTSFILEAVITTDAEGQQLTIQSEDGSYIEGDWFTVYTSNTVVVLLVDENTSGEERSLIIVLKSDDWRDAITITQEK